MKKIVSLTLISLLLASSSLYAKNDKEKKNKNIPYGLQKKVNNGGTLPPGWQKKIKKGEVVDSYILNNAIEIKSKDIESIRNTKVYKLQERIFRIANDTKQIMEILK